MSYATQPQTARPAAILGAIGIPAAFAGLLVVGLAVKEGVAEIYTGPLPTREFPQDPPPPPPDQPQPRDQTARPLDPIVVPPLPEIFPPKPTFVDTTDKLPPLAEEIQLGEIDTTVIGDPLGSIVPTPDPVAATPRNQPSRWVTNGDYRPRWVREGLSGTARFDLAISSKGRVTDCTITKSTGHAQLDTATCKLIAKRARFNPALNSNGNPVSGSYSSAVNWQLPD